MSLQSVSRENIEKKYEKKTIDPSEIPCMDKVRYKTVMFLQSAFHWWAKKVVLRFPVLNILFSMAWTGFLLAGFKDIEFTTDPIRLWASPESRSFQEYTKYNEYFNPFYRASMVIAKLRPEYADIDGGDFVYSSPQELILIYIITSQYLR